MDFTVVVCTYNRAFRLAKTLQSLTKMSVPENLNWELIVVDNHSTDSTRDLIEQFARGSGGKVRYLFEGRQGASYARNAGIASANGEIVAFTDDDVVVAPGWLVGLANTFFEFNPLGVGGKSIPDWGDLLEPNWLDMTGPYGLGSAPLVSFDLGTNSKLMNLPPWGVNMAFRRSAFDKYGLFRTDLGPRGSEYSQGEETEFGRRLLLAGERIAYASEAIVFHPVVPERLTRNYFLSYYYALGRSDVRTEGLPPATVFYFGTPRHLVRTAAAHGVRWLFSLNKKQRFYHKAWMYRNLGAISEACSPVKLSK